MENSDRIQDLRRLKGFLEQQLTNGGVSEPARVAGQYRATLAAIAALESGRPVADEAVRCDCAARFAALLDADLEKLDEAHPRRGSLGPRSHWVDECGEDGFWERVASSVARSQMLMSMKLSR